VSDIAKPPAREAQQSKSQATQEDEDKEAGNADCKQSGRSWKVCAADRG
jgi:hypothetical protein